jgi:DNA processing protein
VLGGKNGGAHALLRDGAKLVETADDILEEIPAFLTRPGLGIGDLGAGSLDPEEPRAMNLASQDPVLRSMDEGDPYDLDEIAARCGIDRVKLLPRLLELELCGALRRIEGGRFVRFQVPRLRSGHPHPGSKRGPC